MKLKPLTLAVLIATAQLSGGSLGQSSKMPASPPAQTAPAAAQGPLALRQPTDWIT